MKHTEMVSDPTMQELDKKFRRILEKSRLGSIEKNEKGNMSR